VNQLGPGNAVAAPPLTGIAAAVAVTRLACVALAVLAACVAAVRFFRRDADRVNQLLLAGMVANLAAYLPSSLAGHTALNAREFAPVLPFAAVLAARTLGDPLGRLLRARPTPAGPSPRRAWPGRRALAAALAALLGWYGFGLGRTAATFLLTSAAPGYFSRWLPSPAALRRLGPLLAPASPALPPPGAGFQVRAYQGNLLAALPRLAHCR